MTTAADFIAALLSRKPAPLVDRATRLPFAWAVWVRRQLALRGPIDPQRARLTALAAAGQGHAARQREPELGAWRAFFSLFRQGWHAPGREERGLRWAGRVGSLLLHLCFAVLFAWGSWVHIPPPPDEAAEETRTRLEFVGDGTPGDEVGGAQAGQSEPAADTANARRGQRDGGRPRTGEDPATQPAEAQVEDASEAVPEVAAPRVPDLPQPQVRAARLPEALPTVREREVVAVQAPALQQVVQAAPTPPVRSVEVQVREREVALPVEAPALSPVTAPAVPARVGEARLPAVRERELTLPVERPALPSVAAPVVQVRPREPGLPSVRERSLALASPQSSDAPPGAAQGRAEAAPAPDASPSTPASTPGQAETRAPAAPAATHPGVATAPTGNAGPVPAARAGASPSLRRADDWGDARRNQAGTPSTATGSGLFDADGKPRLPSDVLGGTATAPGAPGSRQAAARDAAAADAFLRRVPYPYEPTMFDKDWVPRESLLQEWVRKNIREVEVSIPGTSKKVRCVVSLLQLGGGCSLSDGNLHDQPAEARPPPDIPVKRNPLKTDS